MIAVEVAAAIVLNNPDKSQANDELKVLVSLRKKDAHQGGLWEFPGGKVDPGETVEQALVRELKEELNVSTIKNQHLKTVNHHYPDKTVNIHFYIVTEHSGEPCSMEGQDFKWVTLQELSQLEFPQANIDAVKAVQAMYYTG